MFQKIKTIINLTGGIIGVATSVFFLTFVVLAWTGPLNNPPTCPEGEVGCNVVIHTGTAAQSKAGGLLLNTEGTESGLIVENGNVGIGITSPNAKLNVKGGGIKIDPDTVEKPTCDITTRGTMWAEYSDVSGEGDEFFYCRKNSYDSYEWQAIVTDEPLVATGGTISTFVGNGTNGVDGKTYQVHSFTSSGVFNVESASSGATVEVLVLAGGGGGSGGKSDSFWGSGGAGGTIVYNPEYPITPGLKTVTVGGGGSGGALNVSGQTGGNSVFDTIVATGGAGSVYNSRCGGSNADYSGACYSSWLHSGGGAGSGGNGSANNGGIGYRINPGASITGTYVARGGGGGGGIYGTAVDGGGAGGAPASAGTANKGGGGGGGGEYQPGKAGGSGIVIVRYIVD